MSEALVLGAGLTGLTAAHVLWEHTHPIRVFEATRWLGGTARTASWGEFRFDLGGHRFYTRNEDVLSLVRRLLGEELLTVPRMSRIYLRGHLVDYPLTFFNALAALGPLTSAAVAASYAAQKGRSLFRKASDETFEDWVVTRFGRKLYQIYFKPYSEKVWGMSCSELEADFAAQRIRGMSFREAVKGMFLRDGEASESLVSQFFYPKLGFGRIPEKMAETLPTERLHLSSPVVRVAHDGARIREVTVAENGVEESYDAEQVLSTVPISELVDMMDPPAPEQVREAAKKLRYRDVIILFLAIERESVTRDQWIYFPDCDTFFGRMHEPKNWSAAMSPSGLTGLVVEVFCYEHEPIWRESEESLISRAAAKLEELEFIKTSEIIGGCDIRLRKAYPLYCRGYQDQLAILFGYLSRFSNLQCAGRNGLFRYTSGDRYIEMGLKAASNVLGQGRHDVHRVATEKEYAEK